MTRISFHRSAGIIGQEMDIYLDLDGLPAHEALTLEGLVGQSNFFSLPENLLALTTPNEFQYTLTVQARSGRHTIQVTDTSITQPLRHLIDELASRALFRKLDLP